MILNLTLCAHLIQIHWKNCVNVLKGTVHCVLTQLLVPPVQIALGDHEYICNPEDENGTDSITNLSTICDQSHHCSELDHYLQGLDMKPPAEEKSSVNVSPAERQEIEYSTQCRSKASQWNFLRARRIAGSKCGTKNRLAKRESK